MRYLPPALAALLTCGLILLFNGRLVLPAPLGALLSPQHGIWQNAEPRNADYNDDVLLPGLEGKADVYIDERLVPHVFAENENDLYYVQGYLHAKFRLWQMEFQTYAAAGRLSEVLGEGPDGRILGYDRTMRRLGMVWAAEKSMEEADRNPASKAQYEAYANGINAWIAQLSESNLPIEYKLLGYYPEQWTPLKTALFLKFMSYDLAGHEEDLEFSNARDFFNSADLETLFPFIPDSLPAIQPNTAASPYPGQPAVDLTIPPGADSVYFRHNHPDSIRFLPAQQPEKENGSNNWAVAGAKTRSGRPILCNDPHLGLNLPSLWFEMQLTTPQFSAYGATFPGSPNVIIGFNNDISFGFTNAGRDVRDYYEVEFRDETRDAYRFNNDWLPTTRRVEIIRIKGKPDLLDTVVYTNIGPVMYDENFQPTEKKVKNLAVRWKAHDASNDGAAFYGLNHAKTYAEAITAIRQLKCPGQNCLIATRSGDIGIWQQGEFPAKWRRQGDYIMPGQDSSYFWRGLIPAEENPHLENPSRGYVSSANQVSVDGSYPYYTGDMFPVYRAMAVNRMLDTAQQVTPASMMAMQTSNFNIKAAMSRDILLRTPVAALNEAGKKYFEIYRQWNDKNDPGEEGATVFSVWWDALEKKVWKDEFSQTKLPLPWPPEYVLLESLQRDSAYRFIDDISTPGKETLEDVLASSLSGITDSLDHLQVSGNLAWERAKDTRIKHLLKVIEPFNRLHVPVGGGKGIINAAAPEHGPSWRMVVEMTDGIEAYGIYPGGQSGNPGSRYYDNSIDDWAAGRYYRLWLMKESEKSDGRIRWTMHFRKA